jgi:HEPN domain-containing protein
MTASRIGRHYIEEARERMGLVRLAARRKRHAAVVRESQECVELFLKGALRLVGVEPARTHDVSHVLKAERGRFPGWFQMDVDRLAAISESAAADRGMAFYGDESSEIGPQELFDSADAKKAREDMEAVARAYIRLLNSLPRALR